mmetsp:Transcript_18820/g.31624  ORF Transcript_18820/g.31624 Transcript_18820/m.31624 type:complete len:1394 (-) Transcript_18820:585-4766(-)|eukprot:CAMPEP_0198222036 /NCGR_PEP_ID=MMETSP1445-20131203/86332_1 /TAXON_ID=36898 /ORGANISM="Pyramimonas sp., Strain CCMP2087" /LENGTH=1393 /DNA_ID=CAMNT_0043900389 /DNA_START=413 /DNA_END=4594 /DNA_ORIENTATION=-
MKSHGAVKLAAVLGLGASLLFRAAGEVPRCHVGSYTYDAFFQDMTSPRVNLPSAVACQEFCRGYRDSIENKSCAFFTYRDSHVTPLADSQFSCELYPSEARAVSFSDSVTITSGDTECCIDEECEAAGSLTCNLQLESTLVELGGDTGYKRMAAAVPESFTVMAWVWSESYTSAGSVNHHMGIMSAIEDNGVYESGRFHWEGAGWALAYNVRPYFKLMATGGLEEFTTLWGDITFEDNQWYHMAATYDGAEMKLYTDGVLEASSSAQSGPILYSDMASSRFALFTYYDLDENTGLSWKGNMAYVGLYNTAFSLSTIADYAFDSYRSPRVGDANLVAGYVFGPNALVEDLTGQFNGTIIQMLNGGSQVMPSLCRYEKKYPPPSAAKRVSGGWPQLEVSYEACASCLEHASISPKYNAGSHLRRVVVYNFVEFIIGYADQAVTCIALGNDIVADATTWEELLSSAFFKENANFDRDYRFITNITKHLVPLRYTKEQAAGLARKTYFDSSFVQTLRSPWSLFGAKTGSGLSIFELELDGYFSSATLNIPQKFVSFLGYLELVLVNTKISATCNNWDLLGAYFMTGVEDTSPNMVLKYERGSRFIHLGRSTPFNVTDRAWDLPFVVDNVTGVCCPTVLAGVSCSVYYDKVHLGNANTFFFYPETKRQYWRSTGARGYEGAHQFCNETYGGSLFLGGMLEGTNIATEGVASRSEQIMAGVAAGLVLDVDRMPVGPDGRWIDIGWIESDIFRTSADDAQNCAHFLYDKVNNKTRIDWQPCSSEQVFVCETMVPGLDDRKMEIDAGSIGGGSESTGSVVVVIVGVVVAMLLMVAAVTFVWMKLLRAKPNDDVIPDFGKTPEFKFPPLVAKERSGPPTTAMLAQSCDKLLNGTFQSSWTQATFVAIPTIQEYPYLYDDEDQLPQSEDITRQNKGSESRRHSGREPGLQGKPTLKKVFGNVARGSVTRSGSVTSMSKSSVTKGLHEEGDVVQGYKVLNELGRGTFGVVYLVRHMANDMLYTIKLYFDMRSKQAIRESYFLELMRENPVVVRLFETFVHSNHLYLVLEYCSNGDLKQYISSNGAVQVPPDLAAQWFTELMLGVGQMHRLKVAHRDLKPANIFITDECFIRIGDLGLCRLMIDPSQTFVGSPIYMSPEQHKNQPYSLAGDIWAVGCTIYELLMKRPPFVGTTIDEVRSNIDSQKFEPIPAEMASSELSAIIASMLDVDSAKRPTLATLLNNPWFVDQVMKLKIVLETRQATGEFDRDEGMTVDHVEGDEIPENRTSKDENGGRGRKRSSLQHQRASHQMPRQTSLGRSQNSSNQGISKPLPNPEPAKLPTYNNPSPAQAWGGALTPSPSQPRRGSRNQVNPGGGRRVSEPDQPSIQSSPPDLTDSLFLSIDPYP